MSSAAPLFFAPYRTPVTDPSTGLMSRPWYLFMQGLFLRVGGSTGAGNDDLEQLVNEDADISGVDQLAIAQAVADLQALGADPADPQPTDAIDALTLLLDADSPVIVDFRANYPWTGIHSFSGHPVAVNASPLASATTQVATGLANFKSAATTSVNNTLAADASMSVTVNETGWYDFEAMLLINETTSGVGGFQFDFAAGAATLANARYGSFGMSNGTAYTNAARTTASLSGFAPITTSAANPDYSICKGSIQVTVAGTFGLRWSQSVTTAGSPTNLLAGSYLKLTKIG